MSTEEKVAVGALVVGVALLAYRSLRMRGSSATTEEGDVLAGICVSGDSGDTACGGELFDNFVDWLTGDTDIYPTDNPGMIDL